MSEQPPILSVSEPLVDRYRRATEKWYPWFKKLFETLRTVEKGVEDAVVEIQQINQVIDGVSARWGVQINANNQVVGLVRLDGAATGSTFTVVADRFIVSLPTNLTTTIQAFIAGVVDGIPTVGINGQLVVDGTISARSLQVDELSAITANVGTVNAGVLVGTKTYMNLTTGEFYINA